MAWNDVPPHYWGESDASVCVHGMLSGRHVRYPVPDDLRDSAADRAAPTAIGSVAHGSSLRQFTGVNPTSLDYAAIRRDVTSYPAHTLLCPVQEHLYGAFMLVNTNASRILTPGDAFGAIG